MFPSETTVFRPRLQIETVPAANNTCSQSHSRALHPSEARGTGSAICSQLSATVSSIRRGTGSVLGSVNVVN